MTAYPTAQVANYELEIDIDRPRARVWRALTEDTNAWWLPSFHMVGEGSIVSMRAEAGGQLIEKREDGGSLLWCTVHMVDPGVSLHMAGFSFPEWGGPGTTLLKLALEDTPRGCKLKVSDAHVGRITDEHIESLRHGWTELFTDGLKRHCESA
jgi:uncharacterized protein YndB with AHSA1/START domain